MKQLLIFLFLLFTSICGVSVAQTTVATGHPLTNFLTPMGGVVTFNVKNNNTYPIRVFRVNSRHLRDSRPRTVTTTVWYKVSAIAAAPGAISAANGWIAAGSFGHNQTSASILPMVSNLAIDIPAGSTYGFAFQTTDTLVVSQLPATVFTTTVGNVDLNTGDLISFTGNMTGPTLTPWGFVGEIEFYPTGPCAGAPEVGSIVGDPGSCNGDSKFYYLQGYIPGGNITYQWQTSNAIGGPYANVGGGSTLYARTSGTTNTFIRCIATCGTQRDTTPVFIDTMKPFYLCYCASAATNVSNSKIDSIEFLTTKTGSNFNLCEAYTDYRNLPTSKIRAGSTFTASMRAGNCTNNNVLNDWGVFYLDLNRNGSFDFTERLGGVAFNILTTQKLSRSIAIPLNSPLGITGFRAMLYNGTAPVSPCGAPSAFGETEDYLVEIVRDTMEAQMNFLDSMTNSCSLASRLVRFNLSNIGRADINPLSVSYSVNNGPPVTESFANLQKDSTRWYTFATPLSALPIGNITVKVWANVPLDTFKGNDTVTGSFINFQTPNPPTITNTNSCVGTPFVDLLAISTAPNITRWYTDAAGTVELTRGDTFKILNPSASTTYYTKSIVPLTSNIGPTNLFPETSITANNSGLVFDVLKERVQINTVRVKFNAGGFATIEIRNSANVLVAPPMIHTIPQATDTVLPVNVRLPIGAGYRILMAVNPGSVSGIFGFTGFPITIPNIIRINSSMIAGSYNTFLDWNITYDICESNLVPVTNTHYSNVNSPSRPLKPRDTLCAYPTKYMYALNSGSSYIWSTGSTLDSAPKSASGRYTLTITNGVGCKTSDTTDIIVKSSPIFSLGNDTTVCATNFYRIASGFTNAGFNHVWQDGTLNAWVTISAPAQVYCSVFNTKTQCGYSDTVNINFRQGPTVELGQDTFICQGSPTITISTPIVPGNCLWDNGSTLWSRSVSSNSKIWVKVTDNSSLQCSTSDTIEITYGNLTKPALGNDTIICGNANEIGVSIQPNMIYRWNSGPTTNFITPLVTGRYILTVSFNGSTCEASDTINITVLPAPSLNLGSNLTTCTKPLILRAQKGFLTYNWGFGAGQQDTFIVNSSNTYAVTATSNCGAFSDNITVTIVDTLQDVYLQEDTIICDPITLSIPTQLPTTAIEWSDGTLGATSIVVGQTGNYWVRLSNQCGARSDAVLVTKDTLPIADFNYTNNGRFVTFTNTSINGVTYKWIQSDTTFSANKNTSYLYPGLNVYEVTLIAYNYCGDTNYITKSIDLSKNRSGIQGANQSATFAIYPNPAMDYVVISNSKNLLKNVQIEVSAIDGRLMKQIHIPILAAKQEFNLNLADLPSGNYIITLESSNTIETHKLTIHK